ncbi:MAG: bacteriohemerythrin [Pseudomonadota bacterium]
MNWKESLSVDVVSLDREHQDLADALDRLFDGLRAGMEQDTFLAALDRLTEKVAAHFAHEERVMRNIGMPDVAGHCHLHRSLLEEVRQFRADQADRFDPRSVEPVEQFLRFWLYRHIAAEDHKIGQHLNRA